MSDDLTQRMSRLETRFDWLDEHGTRGVNALAVQVAQLAKDMGELENHVDEAVRTVKDAGRFSWTQVIAIAALLIPLYALVIGILVTTGK